MVKKKKMLAVLGSVWDFWPLLLMFEEKYDKPKYISFYKPWLKGRIPKQRIIQFNEKASGVVLWPFKMLVRSIRVSRTILKENPDVVNSQHDDANMSMVPVVFLFRKVLRRKSPKFYFWIRNNPLETHKAGMYSSIVRFMYKHAYVMADKIFMQCEENKEIFVKAFPKLKDKIVLFPNVYEIDENLRLSRQVIPKENAKIFKNNFVFINIGRLTEQKGQWYLIRSFAKVAQEHSNARLIIIGDGELRGQLESLAERCGVKDKVFFLGHQENVFIYLKASDAFVFPSLWEGFGNVMVEALSMNTPVISSDCIAGPRRVLCPEIEHNDKVKYPYFGKYGVLMEPFKRKYTWESISEKGLSKQEAQMASLMEGMMRSSKYSNGIERARQFDKKEILRKYSSELD
jgi:glycosyltransferase involved in cell wall biosynthesis